MYLGVFYYIFFKVIYHTQAKSNIQKILWGFRHSREIRSLNLVANQNLIKNQN